MSENVEYFQSSCSYEANLQMYQFSSSPETLSILKLVRFHSTGERNC